METKLKNNPGKKIKVTHIIPSLDSGGAEVMLYRLITNSDRRRFDHEVVSLTSGETDLKSKFVIMDVPVFELGIKRGQASLPGLWRLMKQIQRSRSDIIHAWMYHANLAGSLAALLTRRGSVIWSIHASYLDPETTKSMTRFVVWVTALLSAWFPKKIICCSQISLQIHLTLGFCEQKLLVIYNGFDVDEFAPDPVARDKVRKELGIPKKAPLVGQVARYDAQKDIPNFIVAAGLLIQNMPDVHFLLCGKGIDRNNEALMRLVETAGVSHAIHLLGERNDIARLCAALDIFTLSSSYGEAFPVAVGEAMAVGIIPVVTNIGDSAFLVGKTGKVVKPKDQEGLLQAWLEVLSLTQTQRLAIGLAARERITSKFTISSVTSQYEEVYNELNPIPHSTPKEHEMVQELPMNFGVCELGTQGVSIVMPVYNGERFLEEAIESVLAQTHSHFELLILNDGSTDGTEAIVNRFQDSRIKLVRNSRNLGLTATLNQGLRLAHFELIARHDADDISHPTRLAKQIDFLLEHPELVLVGTQAEIVDERGWSKGQLFGRAQTHESIVWDLLFDNSFTHSSVMFKKSVILNELGGYDESVMYCQDYHLWSEVARHHRVANLPDRLVSYRIHPYSRMSDTMYDVMVMENQSIVRKNFEALLGTDSITREDVEAVVGVRLAFEGRFLSRTLEALERSILLYGSPLNKESLTLDFQKTIARRYLRVAHKAWLVAPLLVFRVLWRSIWRYPVIRVFGQWFSFKGLANAMTRHRVRVSQRTMREL